MSHSSSFNHLKHTNYTVCNFFHLDTCSKVNTISLAFHFQILTTSVLHLGQGIKFHIHKMCKIIALYLFNQ